MPISCNRVNELGPVVGVQRREHKMARKRRFNRNLCRFLVASFTDEDHIGILPQECAQDAGEVEPDVFVRLHLAKARQIVFDRIFRRGDVDFRRVDLVQRTVKRCGLPGTRRARDVDDAVGLVDHPPELLHCRPMQDELVERQQRCASCRGYA